MEPYFLRAINNIISYGDTDVFPFPIENTIFYDRKEDVIAYLIQLHKNFTNELNEAPPFNDSQLSPVGYSGFRWVTQLDPIWNAYFLGLVVSIGELIEKDRVSDNNVFSYRFVNGQDDNLFNANIGWHTFHRRSLELADSYETIVICDISDFYLRIRHHRLENALGQLQCPKEITDRIIDFLQNFSSTYSHGLPIGGPAARMLSELLLNQTDQLLKSEGVQFCRFADDYHIFASSQDEAYDYLLFLSKKLLNNEGLALQKSKTRIMSSAEFKRTSPILKHDESDFDNLNAQAFLTISLTFDPYSLTAEDDYQALKHEIEKFDIIGLLRRELAKSHIDIAVTKQIVKALKYISEPQRDQAILSICDSLANLYPIFPTIILVIKSIWHDISIDARNKVGHSMRQLFREKSHLIKTEINQQYACRLLSYEFRQENVELFQRLFSLTESTAIKRDIILAMFNWRYTAWISDMRNQYRNFTSPLRKAFIIASYALGDEGNHWRRFNKKGFSDFEKIINAWAETKSKQNTDNVWRVPL